jgi:antitoxin component HigA of HigAB toxin-antitoxin module
MAMTDIIDSIKLQDSPAQAPGEVTNERAYHAAVHRIFELMDADPAPNTCEDEELARLVAAVDHFESERFPLSCCALAARESSARVLKLIRTLGSLYDVEQAVQWCEAEQPLLDGRRPADVIISEKGAAEVEAVVATLAASSKRADSSATGAPKSSDGLPMTEDQSSITDAAEALLYSTSEFVKSRGGLACMVGGIDLLGESGLRFGVLVHCFGIAPPTPGTPADG